MPRRADRRQIVGLGADLGPHQLLPELLAQRLADGDLLGDAPHDLRVIGQRQEHAGGQVVAAADDQHGVGAGQAGQRRVGVGGAAADRPPPRRCLRRGCWRRSGRRA